MARPRILTPYSKLGTFLRTAISVGLSRKGSWRLSRTLATQSGMTNQWLEAQGLLSVKDLSGKHPLPGYGSVASGKRQVRTRMLSVVGAGGEKPPATRLASGYFALCIKFKNNL